MNVRRTALLPLPAEHLYDIIEAAENYPRFLPWCVGARLVCRDEHVVSADLQVKWGGMSFEMRTRNPKRRPEYMAIHLERGPFRHFEGEWHVTALAPDACKVLFTLDWEFDSVLMTRVAGPVFKRLTDTMVEAFIQHALATPVPVKPVPSPPEPVAMAPGASLLKAAAPTADANLGVAGPAFGAPSVDAPVADVAVADVAVAEPSSGVGPEPDPMAPPPAAAPVATEGRAAFDPSTSAARPPD